MTQILQISDPHIMPQGRLFQDKIDTSAALCRLLTGLTGLLPSIGPPSHIVVTGDLTETGCDAAYAEFLRLMEMAPLPWLAIPGNHDDRDTMRAGLTGKHWMPPTGPLNWREDLQDLTLLGIDTHLPGSASGAVSPDTLDWLCDMLCQMPKRPVLLFMHHPPIPTGIKGMDAIGLTNAQELAKVLAPHRAPLQICCGHIHRAIFGQFAGHPVVIAPGTSHSLALDMRPDAPISFLSGNCGAVLHHFDHTFRASIIETGDLAVTPAGN